MYIRVINTNKFPKRLIKAISCCLMYSFAWTTFHRQLIKNMNGHRTNMEDGDKKKEGANPLIYNNPLIKPFRRIARCHLINRCKFCLP